MPTVLITKLSNLPDKPGVYIFKQNKRILYIGKATSLKSRVKSYFNKNITKTRGPKIEAMVKLITKVEYQECDSVLEALLQEAILIKKYNPPYNTKAKDDKSFWFVVITKESWPRVLMVRGQDLSTVVDPDQVKKSFGPFPHGPELKAGLKIIRRLFPFRDKCKPQGDLKNKNPKPCFNRQIGLCPGVCTGEISHKEYLKNIKHIILLFEGKKKKLLTQLEKEMQQAARVQDFEQATIYRNRLQTLNNLKDVSVIKRPLVDIGELRIEAYDVAHLAGQNTVGVMVVLDNQGPLKNEYRRFIIKGKAAGRPNDTAALAELLNRRLKHKDWLLPDLIVADGGQAQVGVIEKILQKNKLSIPVVGVVKDEKHRPQKIIKRPPKWPVNQDHLIIAANDEAHRFALAFHRKKRRTMI
ncbi:MAG: UvrB/UvrC motif-containing protein [Patescibacteria group bacterium]